MQTVKLSFNRKKQIQFEVDDNPWYHKEMPRLDGARLTAESPRGMKLEYDVDKISSISIMQKVSEACEIRDVAISGRDIEAIIRDIIRKDNRVR